MSNYKIAAFPQNKYRFQLYDNVNRLTWQQIQKKTGCCALCNLWYFNMVTYSHDVGVMLDGEWERPPEYDWPGICIDKEGRVTTGGIGDAEWGYAASVQADYLDGRGNSYVTWGANGVTYTGLTAAGDVVILLCPRDTPMDSASVQADYLDGRGNSYVTWGANGVTYTGLTAAGDVVILLCPRDTPMDSAEAVQAMLDAGCVDILRWDGSWSSQGSLGPGMDVQPSQRRICRGWLLVYERSGTETDNDKEDKPVSGKKTVCLDPGHGPGTVNGSPDGTYKEREFAWDMGQRVKALLEAQGVEVVLTRTEDNKPSLTERAAVSNQAGADCLVSLHSNAEGSNKLWGSARGLMAYTSAGPTNAPRNVLARDIIDRMKEAGVLVRSTPVAYNIDLTVLVKADAPACLIEYGFHTNREDVALLKDSAYRDKLAAATARGICDWLGVDYAEPQQPEEPAEWYAGAQAWAKELGIADGTRPLDNVTRAEVWVMLKRLYEVLI